MSKLGFNVGAQSYWREANLVMDLMKGTSGWYQTGGWTDGAEFSAYMSGRPNAIEDWLPQLPAGKGVGTVVRQLTLNFTDTPFVEGRGGALTKTGKYIVTWTGAATVSISGDGAWTLVEANRGEFVVPEGGDKVDMYLNVNNNTGSPIDVSDIKIFHADHEARLNQGKLFNVDSLEKLRGARNIRTLDLLNPMWLGQEDNGLGTTQVQVSDLIQESYRTWGNMYPASALGKLITETQEHLGDNSIELWINMPIRFSRTAVTAYITELHSNHPNGKIKVEIGNEIWNSAYPFSMQAKWYYQTYLGGLEADGDGQTRPVHRSDGSLRPPPYTRTGSQGSWVYTDSDGLEIAEWDVYDSMNVIQAGEFWPLVEAVYGRDRHIRLVGTYTFLTGNANTLLNTPVTTLGATGAMSDKIDGFLTNGYMFFKHATENRLMRADEMMRDNWHTRPTSEYLAAAKGWNDSILGPALNTLKTQVQTANSNLELYGYEGYRHFNIAQRQTGYGAISLFTVDAGNNALTYTVTNEIYSELTRDDLFADGEVVRSEHWQDLVTLFNDGSNDYLDAGFTVPYRDKQFYVSRFGTDAIRLHRSQADALAKTNHLTLASGLNATVTLANHTRLTGIQNKIIELNNGSLGRELLIHWFNTCVKPHCAEMNFYVHAGGWNDTNGLTHTSWGLVTSELAADNLAAQEFRKLANVGVDIPDVFSGAESVQTPQTAPTTFSALIGDGSNETLTVTHNLNTNVVVQVVEIATGKFIYPNITVTNSNTLSIFSKPALPANGARIIVIGESV